MHYGYGKTNDIKGKEERKNPNQMLQAIIIINRVGLGLTIGE
jgi:hypothetical protein